jgi:hypothetical protein
MIGILFWPRLARCWTSAAPRRRPGDLIKSGARDASMILVWGYRTRQLQR